MNKEELTLAISKETGLTIKDSKKFLEAFTYIIGKRLTMKDSVKIYGFGTFKVTKYNSRMTINPRTKERMRTPAMYIPKFKASTTLKETVHEEIPEKYNISG